MRTVAYGFVCGHAPRKSAGGDDMVIGAGVGSPGDEKCARIAETGAMSSRGTFSPSVRLSLARWFFRVSVAVEVAGVRRVVG